MKCQFATLCTFGNQPCLGESQACSAPGTSGDILMPESDAFSSDVAFTPAVKAIQARKGSRDRYAQMEQGGGWRTEIDENLTAFLAGQDSMFLATATAEGQPYI